MSDAPESLAPYAVRAYRRRASWMFALFIGLNLANLVMPNLAGGVLPRLSWFALPLFVVIGVAGWLVLAVAWERRLLARLRQADHLLCPTCGYTLVGHEGDVRCPECGRACDLEQVRETWQAFRPRISGSFIEQA